MMQNEKVDNFGALYKYINMPVCRVRNLREEKCL